MDLTVATALLLQYKYALMVPLAVIEGPILSMVCGLFIKTGALVFLPTFAALAAGDLIGDALWYWVGRNYGHRFIARFGKYFTITEENVATVQRIFDKYHTSILLFSKLTMGLGFPGVTLFTAGMTRIRFWKFMALNSIGQIGWTGMLLAVGYYLGDIYLSFENVFGLISAGSLMALAFLALFGFGRYVRATITRNVS